MSVKAPDTSRSRAGGSTARSSRRMLSHRTKTPASWGAEIRNDHDLDAGLSMGISRPPTMASQNGSDMVKQANIRDVGNRSSYNAGNMSRRSLTQRSAAGRSRPATGFSQASGSCYSEEGMDYTNTLSLIGAKNRPDPGAPTAATGYGSPTKAHVISDSYGRYEADIKRRQESSNKLDQESSDRQRLQSQVEVLKSQKKREEERREKLVPYDLTHVLPLERDRDFFQEYAEKQGMKRALFKQMDEKKAIKQRELDRERAMDLESKEALAVS